MTNIIPFASLEYLRGAREARKALASGRWPDELYHAWLQMMDHDDYHKGYGDTVQVAMMDWHSYKETLLADRLVSH